MLILETCLHSDETQETCLHSDETQETCLHSDETQETMMDQPIHDDDQRISEAIFFTL
jgi:hypothetical protein